MTQASEQEAAEKEHRDRLRDSNHEEYCNPICFEDGWDAGIAYARREMEGEIGDYKNVLETVIGSHHEAFLYEKRESSNIPGSLDQPRNAYNITLTLAQMAREVLNKYGSRE